MKKVMGIKQKIRRFWQQSPGLDAAYTAQFAQIEIAKKLYARNGFDLQLTCSACPEQYDVFFDGNKAGYLRLRHGRFTLEYPDCMEELLLDEYPDGDGMFEQQERLVFLTKALRAIQARMKEDSQ